MVWGKMDDKFHRNRKVRALRKRGKEGNAALGVWSFWWSWCLDDPELSGVIPSSELSSTDRKLAILLVGVGLWEKVENVGFAIHDFHAYNPTRAQVDAKRLADRERVAAKRDATRGNVASDSDATTIRRRIHARSPVPSQPNPEREREREGEARAERAGPGLAKAHPSRLLPVLREELAAEAFERNLQPAPMAAASQLQAAAERLQELVAGKVFAEPRAAARALVRSALDLVRDHKRPFGLALLDATVAPPAPEFHDHVLPWGRV